MLDLKVSPTSNQEEVQKEGARGIGALRILMSSWLDCNLNIDLEILSHLLILKSSLWPEELLCSSIFFPTITFFLKYDIIKWAWGKKLRTNVCIILLLFFWKCFMPFCRREQWQTFNLTCLSICINANINYSTGIVHTSST